MEKWVLYSGDIKNSQGKDKDKEGVKRGFSIKKGKERFLKGATFLYFAVRIFISCPERRE